MYSVLSTHFARYEQILTGADVYVIYYLSSVFRCMFWLMTDVDSDHQQDRGA